MEDVCCPAPLSPSVCPAAQSPTVAETLHPAFSGVQQYTGREAAGPRPTSSAPTVPSSHWSLLCIAITTAGPGPIQLLATPPSRPQRLATPLSCPFSATVPPLSRPAHTLHGPVPPWPRPAAPAGLTPAPVSPRFPQPCTPPRPSRPLRTASPSRHPSCSSSSSEKVRGRDPLGKPRPHRENGDPTTASPLSPGLDNLLKFWRGNSF